MEVRLKAKVAVEISGSWYRETGSGMGASLNTAVGINADFDGGNRSTTDDETFVFQGVGIRHDLAEATVAASSLDPSTAILRIQHGEASIDASIIS